MAMEIGSEFHRMEIETACGLTLPGNGTLVFSGRTAIETVLKELPNAKKAVLPSYCCASMIDPFRKAGIEVTFYPVWYECGLCVEPDIPVDADILLWCNYFGFSTPMPDMSIFKARGGVIIEDITHSLFSACSHDSQSDYLVASLRKWEPLICGGYCASLNGQLGYVPVTEPPESFVNKKHSAMELKKEYLHEMDEEKKYVFLSLFEISNNFFAGNYSGLKIDPWSESFLARIDMETQKKIRRNNAHILYQGLKNKVEFLFSEDDMDCPLFVPVVIPDRDKVRQILTQNRIYCPIHWPKPERCVSNIYDIELSLVCDQRYNEDDMEHIVSVLEKTL